MTTLLTPLFLCVRNNKLKIKHKNWPLNISFPNKNCGCILKVNIVSIAKIYNGFPARGCSAVTAVEYGKTIWCNLNSVLELWIVIEVTNADTFHQYSLLAFKFKCEENLLFCSGWSPHFISVTGSGRRIVQGQRVSPFYARRQLKAIFIKPLLDARDRNSIPRMVRQ